MEANAEDRLGSVEAVPYRHLTRANTRAIAAAAERYGRFMSRTVMLSMSQSARAVASVSV